VKTCSECGIEIEDRSQGRRRKTCSRHCRDKRYYRIEKEKKGIVFLECPICSTTFERGKKTVYCSNACNYEATKIRAKQNWVNNRAKRPDFKELPCTWCEKPVIIRSSFPGLKVTHDDCKKERIRARNRTKNTKRRGYQLSRQRIGIENIGDRDGWVCHICEKPVDPFLPGNHKEGPTFDHVIPLSKGGSDEPDNLKLAHWICNIRKLDKVDYAQSR